MADSSNPGNFANRPKEEVKEIASKGGQASGTPGGSSGSSDPTPVTNEGRNPDGTFAKGSAAAKEAGAKGGSN
ncbi:hypothetical protein MMC34_000968 [Xylographa carneopallida]|nr:hypothetical protein [Xylographa carneopallida]